MLLLIELLPLLRNQTNMAQKPFTFGIPTSGDTFTDRKKETERLLANFKHGVNTVLISPRRWGKTSLVRKVCGLAQSEELKIVYIDAFPCRSEREFCDAYASAVLKQTSSKMEEWLENAKTFLSRINPKISIGNTPMADLSVSMELNPKTDDIEEVLQLPERIAQKKNIRIVMCIDEFQQVAEFKESLTFQKRLRSVWQLQESVSYCIFGSKKHLMNELFESKSRPFYKFGDAMYLMKIGTDDWVEYICERFKASGKSISKELAGKICGTAENHSYYVQQLAWLVWYHSGKEATEADFNEAYEDIIAQNTPLFEKQTESLTSYQMNLLRAILDGVEAEFTSSDVIKKYQLSSSANVSIVKRALIKKELIDTEKRRLIISDPILKLWLRRELG